MTVSALAMPCGARGFGLQGQGVMLVLPKRDGGAAVPLTGLVVLTRDEAEQLHAALGEALATFGRAQAMGA